MIPKGKILAGAALLLALGFGPSAVAQQKPETMRIRGAVVSLDGSSLIIKTRQGANVTVMLADQAKFLGVVKAAVSDIKPDAKVFTSATKQADGSWTAGFLAIGKDGVVPPM